MCARFTLAAPDRVPERYPQYRSRRAWPPRFNVAPTHDVLAVRAGGDELEALRWGLVPSWAKDRAIGGKLINARAETLAEKPAFRGALEGRRCLIFADGFYEWSGPKSCRQPHRFTVDDGRPFAFAGLWDRWGPRDRPLETCTIVTCAPNALLATIHDRMPAILDDAAIELWLHAGVADALAALVPYDAHRMRSTTVSREVNRPDFDDPRAIEPMPAEQTFF